MDIELYSRLKIKFIDGVQPPLRMHSTPMDISYINANWELFQKAVWLVITEKNAKVSLLQRKLRLPYNQASLLIDYMVFFGLIGPFDLNRDIYVEFI
ncbi:hypothetical protein KQJ23_15300 [Paenibacillus sp. MSJ-6]|uniref:FtsK gamma domain-containing protein n=2 Tax=Paenibacillus brevis TaxID=2841508 RepID=A0ABS6FSH4_9BACL|nr:hypothetical protein [Paenibacillus brevis]